MGDTGENGRIGDFVTVEMQDGQHGAIAGWIQEFVCVPTGGERAGLSFAVADHTRDEQIGVVESGAISVSQGVTEFAALMNRAGRFRGSMAGNAPWEGKLSEQTFHSRLVL